MERVRGGLSIRSQLGARCLQAPPGGGVRDRLSTAGELNLHFAAVKRSHWHFIHFFHSFNLRS